MTEEATDLGELIYHKGWSESLAREVLNRCLLNQDGLSVQGNNFTTPTAPSLTLSDPLPPSTLLLRGPKLKNIRLKGSKTYNCALANTEV